MKPRTLITSSFILLLFLVGILLEIAISAAVLWGELEARLYIPSSVGSGLSLKCPYVLSFDETGTISASVINTQNQNVEPMVTVEISRNNGIQQMSQTLTLAPHESKTVKWNVDASDILFDRLIVIGVLQGKDGDLPAHQGYCGILLLNLLSMKGQEAFIFLCLISFALLIFGGVLWLRIHSPLNIRDRNIARAFGSLAILATMSLLTALLRWWGLIIILDTITLIVMIVIFTDVLFNPSQRRI